MTEVITALMDGVVVVLIALIGTLAAYASSALHAYTKRIKDKNIREFANEALDRVDDLASKVVTRTEQTVAKQLREDVKNGFKEEGDLAALGTAACQVIMESLSDEYIAAIEDAVGDIEAYIADTVETKVYELKQYARPLLDGSDFA